MMMMAVNMHDSLKCVTVKSHLVDFKIDCSSSVQMVVIALYSGQPMVLWLRASQT